MSKEGLFVRWERGERSDEITRAFGTPHDEYVWGSQARVVKALQDAIAAPSEPVDASDTLEQCLICGWAVPCPCSVISRPKEKK